ncbi:MAG: hypothetical protein IJN96_03795 [Clostridia bacterium]|nr:hypothetical protein [Clostridia bacterium]
MISNTQRIFKGIITVLTLYLTVFLVILPQNCLSAAKEGLSLCLNNVIPSLFPFFVCSGILAESGFSVLCSRFLSSFMRPLFRLPGAGAMTFLLGTVSGYPVGASSAAQLYSSGQCTLAEAQRMTSFCNNSSPIFIIGLVGTGLLGNPSIGYLLYASHIVSALITGLIFRFYGKEPSSSMRTLPSSGHGHTKKTALFSFGGIIDRSVFSTLKVCGFIIFFSVFAQGIPSFGGKPYLCSFIEIAGGTQLLVQAAPTHRFFLPVLSFFLGFSGLSVMLQIASIIIPQGLSMKPVAVGKLLQGIFSFVITLLLTNVFPVTQAASVTADYSSFPTEISVPDSILSALLSVFFVVMLLKGIIFLSSKSKIGG